MTGALLVLVAAQTQVDPANASRAAATAPIGASGTDVAPRHAKFRVINANVHGGRTRVGQDPGGLSHANPGALGPVEAKMDLPGLGIDGVALEEVCDTPAELGAFTAKYSSSWSIDYARENRGTYACCPPGDQVCEADPPTSGNLVAVRSTHRLVKRTVTHLFSPASGRGSGVLYPMPCITAGLSDLGGRYRGRRVRVCGTHLIASPGQPDPNAPVRAHQTQDIASTLNPVIAGGTFVALGCDCNTLPAAGELDSLYAAPLGHGRFYDSGELSCAHPCRGGFATRLAGWHTGATTAATNGKIDYVFFSSDMSVDRGERRGDSDDLSAKVFAPRRPGSPVLYSDHRMVLARVGLRFSGSALLHSRSG